MNLIILMAPLATLLSAFFLVLFLRANARGEFDDLETPAYRLLNDRHEPGSDVNTQRESEAP